MGLDITAYRNLKYIGQHEKNPNLNEGEPGGLDDCCYYYDHIEVFAYADFPKSFRGIPVVKTKRVGGTNLLVAGCYAVTPQTQTYDFQAGSYGGYGRWRDDLRRQFNPGTDPDLPFYELIWFADNEGSIGELAAVELLVDFRAHVDRYQPAEHEQYMREKYQDWTRACELAADGGLIRFH